MLGWNTFNKKMPSSSGLRQCVRDVSPYLLLLVAISTLGPLQFGFHLVRLVYYLIINQKALCLDLIF